MDCRFLDITVNSAKGLKDLNLFSKMDLYAVVSIHDNYYKNTHIVVKIKAKKKLKWNFPMKFTVDINAVEQNLLALVVKIKAKKKLTGDKEVGEVHVPMKELLQSFGNGESSSKDEKHVTYNVRTPSGKAKGVLDFTYKFGEKFTATKPKPEPKNQPPQSAYNGRHPRQPAWYPQPRWPGIGGKTRVRAGALAGAGLIL